MKKLNLLIGLLIAFIIFACSPEDVSTQESENVSTQESENVNTVRFYKKSETYNNGNLIFDKTVNYTSDNKIQSIITNNYGSKNDTITVNYSENEILSITELAYFDNPYSADEKDTYNVMIENNKITLKSDRFVIEINHSQGYVDSTTLISFALPGRTFDQIFTRDSNLNLISNTSGTFIYNYSNFDSDKMIDPIGGVTQYFLSDYFKIFDLKVTNNNPLKAIYNIGNNSYTYNESLEYDNSGYVIRTTRTTNISYSTPSYTEHQYIE